MITSGHQISSLLFDKPAVHFEDRHLGSISVGQDPRDPAIQLDILNVESFLR